MALGKAVDRRTAEMIARVLQTSITQMDQTGVLNDPSALFATLSCAFEKLVNDIEEKSSETQETDQKLHPEVRRSIESLISFVSCRLLPSK